VLNTRRLPFVAVLLALLARRARPGRPAAETAGTTRQGPSRETFSGDKKVTSGKIELKLGLQAEGTASLGGPIA
jgi:hypothetical protein